MWKCDLIVFLQDFYNFKNSFLLLIFLLKQYVREDIVGLLDNIYLEIYFKNVGNGYFEIKQRNDFLYLDVVILRFI